MAFLGSIHALPTNYQNPASPDVLTTPPPWEIPRSDTATPTAAMHVSSDLSHVLQSSDAHPVVPPPGPTLSAPSQSTGDLPVSDAEAMRTDCNASQDFADLDSKSSVTAVSLQADPSGAELSGLNDSTEPTDDIPEDRPGISGTIR